MPRARQPAARVGSSLASTSPTSGSDHRNVPPCAWCTRVLHSSLPWHSSGMGGLQGGARGQLSGTPMSIRSVATLRLTKRGLGRGQSTGHPRGVWHNVCDPQPRVSGKVVTCTELPTPGSPNLCPEGCYDGTAPLAGLSHWPRAGRLVVRALGHQQLSLALPAVTRSLVSLCLPE